MSNAGRLKYRSAVLVDVLAFLLRLLAIMGLVGSLPETWPLWPAIRHVALSVRYQTHGLVDPLPKMVHHLRIEGPDHTLVAKNWCKPAIRIDTLERKLIPHLPRPQLGPFGSCLDTDP
jgi:hypothetical protein